MADAVQHIAYGADDAVTHYTASYSPYLQGTEIVQVYQLLNYTNVKARSNTSLVTALSGAAQNYMAVGEGFQSYNDSRSPENFGGSSSQKSSANLFTQNRFDTYISHFAEQRDLGQINTYDDGNPFTEPDDIDSPVIIVSTNSEALVAPTNLVQVCSSPASFDGVIEAVDIRRVADRSSVDLPFVVKGPKGSLSVTDDLARSYQFSDTSDTRQFGTAMGAAPYLDYVENFGSALFKLDQPGAFSDSEEKLSAFRDRPTVDVCYPVGSLDSEMRALFVAGVTSGSQQVMPPEGDCFPTYLVAARHGFTFSQNDNYGYDSIAFGGLKK